MYVGGNLTIEYVSFFLEDDNSPINCTISDGTNVYIGVILRNSTSLPRKLRQIAIYLYGTQKCLPAFNWIGTCGIPANSTQSFIFPTFKFNANNINPVGASIIDTWILDLYVVDQEVTTTIPNCSSIIFSNLPRDTQC